MNGPKAVFLRKAQLYTGEQLRSHWARVVCGVDGDSVVAFIGPCDVTPEHMKDLEDLLAGSRIYSEKMLHFIVEHFDVSLTEMVWRQRALMALMAEELNRRLKRARVRREGSDLYDGDRKLTVSIASASPVSALIHAGINISRRNTPVPTRGLGDYRIAPTPFAKAVMERYAEECRNAWRARRKVRPCE
jgi:hypothetical protein